MRCWGIDRKRILRATVQEVWVVLRMAIRSCITGLFVAYGVGGEN